MAEKRCLACGEKLEELAVFHNMPKSAQEFPTKEELATEKGMDLSLCQCRSCGLVQFDTEAVPYYKDVIRAGGGSSTMKALREEEYGKLLSFLAKKEEKRPLILELGAGAGEFLGMWSGVESDSDKSSDVSSVTSSDTASVTSLSIAANRIQKLEPYVLGIEHKKELVEKGQVAGLSLYQGFPEAGFELENMEGKHLQSGKTRPVEGLLDAMVQFNFLEHQPNPGEMLSFAYEHLKMGGYFLLTVPSFQYILDHRSYYELLRDHIANYSEESLLCLVQDQGFSLVESRVINRDTIEFLLEKSEKESCTSFRSLGQKVDIEPILENERAIQEDIKKHLEGLRQKGERMAVWGASHQGLTLLSTTALQEEVAYIIDSAPFKQGKYSPASHLPIVDKSHFQKEPVEEILIVAPGYTEEIAGIIRRDLRPCPRVLALRGEKIEEL